MLKKNKKLEDLINLVENSKINEIEISTFWGAKKIRISKNNTRLHAKSKVKHDIVVESKKPEIKNKTIQENFATINLDNQQNSENNVDYITAPLVGTFYLRPNPTDPPYVNVGDSVKKGQIIGIIEAMKIFNEIECDYNGKITEIMVSDSEPVEYNQNLFKIEK